MPADPVSLKSTLRPGCRKTGLWLSLCAPTATEIAAGSGADWLLIDMEHSPWTCRRWSRTCGRRSRSTRRRRSWCALPAPIR